MMGGGAERAKTPAQGNWRRPRSFAAGEGGDDARLSSGKKKQPTRALPFPRSFTFGQQAKDVMSKEEQVAVSTLIDSMNAAKPGPVEAAAEFDEEVLEYAGYFGALWREQSLGVSSVLGQDSRG
jgi:hypothetical protein